MRRSDQFGDSKLDFLFAFPDGMDSGIAPLLLPKTQLAYASNATVRGTFVSPRPPWDKMTLDFGGNSAVEAAFKFGLYQGGTYYQPDTGPEQLIVAITGRLYKITPTGLTATVVDVTGANPQDPTVLQHWLWQAEYFVFWNDGVNATVFYDGNTSTTQRSFGQVQIAYAVTAGAAVFIGAPGTTGIVITLAAPYPGVDGDILNLEQFGQLSVTAHAGNQITVTNISVIPTPQFYAPPMNLFLYDATKPFVPQFPAGRMGCYGLGRVWMCMANGRNFVAGDIVGGPSGTAANNFRDSITNLVENNYLFGGGQFTIPTSGEQIRAMIFTSTLDVSLGQGPLQVFTPKRVFSCQAPVNRQTWSTVQNPILTESLIGQGALGQNSTVASNGDTIFRSLVGAGSLILGRRNFATWGNVPISREMQRTLSADPQQLLPYGSAVNFDNRLLMTTHPVNSSRGVSHRGMVVINYDPLSNLHGKAPSVWDGTWPNVFNMQPLQLLTGEFDLVDRMFAPSRNESANEIELWQLHRSEDAEYGDNQNADAIYWFIESPVLKFGEENALDRTFKKLVNGEIYVDKLQGRVRFEAFYRPDQYPCWIPWLTFEQCAQNTEGQIDMPQFRPRLGLGTPSMDNCDPNTNRPFPYGYTFQFKLVVTGKCEFLGAKFTATVEPEPTFLPQCTPLCE